jgi:hypothetical protein
MALIKGQRHLPFENEPCRSSLEGYKRQLWGLLDGENSRVRWLADDTLQKPSVNRRSKDYRQIPYQRQGLRGRFGLVSRTVRQSWRWYAGEHRCLGTRDKEPWRWYVYGCDDRLKKEDSPV